MKYSVEIGKIIEGALAHNHQKMINYTELLIENLEKNNDHRSAKKFANLLENSKQKTLNPMKAFSAPVDKESRQSLVDVFYPSKERYNVILNKVNQEQVELFIDSYKKKDLLRENGIEASNNLLIYGPPGTGKTQTAFYIAKELGLPLYVSRLDSLISSYLGTTAKNIQTIFQYAENTPSVLFLDEFDAIAKARDDDNELGELKRVVNSLIQNIDFMSSDSILIVATNHEKLLDNAIWRRFNYKLKIDFPDKASIKGLLKEYNNDYIYLSEDDLEELSCLFEGISGADIKEIFFTTIKKNILNDEKQKVENIYTEYFNFISFNYEFNNERHSNQFKAKYLREKNHKLFTYKRIGEILNIATSTVSNLIKEE